LKKQTLTFNEDESQKFPRRAFSNLNDTSHKKIMQQSKINVQEVLKVS
jgi:hypothetical protein